MSLFGGGASRRPGDAAILVFEPGDAGLAGVNIPGAFHGYAPAIYTDDPRYSASLQGSGIPVEFVTAMDDQRNMGDSTGVGNLIVDVPSNHSPFHTLNFGQGYTPVPGAFNAVFWYRGFRGTAVLHFHDQPFSHGSAISCIDTAPFSIWNDLFEGGGIGPCDARPETG